MKKTLVVFVLLILLLLGVASGIFSYDECSAPPFIAADATPLVMLAMERDHKLYYEAYNDATDLDGDGRLDTGYKDAITYFGYFDSDKCYTYEGSGQDRFIPSRFAPNANSIPRDHYCGGAGEWSGNFLNWLSMSRMDIIKRVLYGGHRSTDSASETVLEGVYIPQDAHSWGKEYSGSDTRLLAPFDPPTSGTRHLFCVTSQSAGAPHVIKVARSSPYRKWDWASSETPVCSGPNESSRVVGWRSEGPGETQMQIYTTRIKACAHYPDLDQTYCKLYPGGGTTYKPIGLLQKYAEGTGTKICSKSWKTCNSNSDCSRSTDGLCMENTGMYLGLMTGSYRNNTRGGLLRKNIWSILDEINYSTGIFQSSENVQGNIILSLDRMKTLGFTYSSHSYTDSSGGTCGWITDHALNNGECRMWGNPIGEIMYEALRYLAGKSAGTTDFTSGVTKTGEANLTLPDWGVTSGGRNYKTYDIYPSCARPFLLVISDVNVSYDSDQLPGSSFASFTGDLPNLNVSTLANTIGANEGVAGSKFIGDNGTISNTICTAKNVTNLSSIRGLCPEEPTKQGSFYSAAVAYYGKTMFQDNTGKPDVTTLAVALASPVPDISIAVGGSKVRIVPAGKSVSGGKDVYNYCFGRCPNSYSDVLPGGTGLHLTSCSATAFCPSNQIVDFYVEDIQYDDQNNITSAVFRINFEDVEQGADHDMDAIVQYTIQAIGSNQIRVGLDSSVYGVGSIDQALGFVISGTTEDGTYFVVKDNDVSGRDDNTTSDSPTPKEVADLPKQWNKTFTVTGSTAGILHDPLWYAAKWGGFTDTDGSRLPDRDRKWDRDGDGVPDNYFFVANPLELYAQMERAFTAILNRGGSAGAVATVTQQVQGRDMLVRGAFTSYEDDPRSFVWKGHLETYWPYEGCGDFMTREDCETYAGCTWDSSGAGTCSGWIYAFQKPENQGDFCYQHHDHCWEAEEHLPNPASRTIFTWLNGQKVDFNRTNLCSTNELALTGDANYGSDNCTNMVNWIRGQDGWIKARDRDGWTLGDIVYSTPVVVQQPSLSAVPKAAVGSCTDGCACTDSNNTCRMQSFLCFRECQKTRKKMIYVGANDGMVHAFISSKWNASQQTWITDPAVDSEIGKELWAYVPSNLLTKLKELARLSYGTDGFSSCVHRFMVDLSPQAWEVYIDPDGIGPKPRQWRTVLLGGERGGGDDFFALDVTDPDDPQVLWEYSAFRNMVQMGAGSNSNSYTVQTPYRNKTIYDQVKALPSSWAFPYAGKLKLPEGVSFLAAPPVSPLAAGNPTLTPSYLDNTSLSGWVAVIPTAPRIFKLEDLPTTSASSSVALSQKLATLKPNLLMIDIEKGINIFQYLWPLLLATQPTQWPVATNDTNYIPYASGTATVLDVWKANGQVGLDGYLDHIYFGDLNGRFYGLKFNLEDSNKGMEIDSWQTKSIPLDKVSTNTLRSNHEPISIMPTAAFDRNNGLHLYFGTGKYDVIKGANNDKTDTSRMALYMLKDSSPRPTISATATVTGEGPIAVSGSAASGFRWNNFGVDVNPPHCNGPSPPTFNSNCTWVTLNGTQDCCESSNTDCATPCWDCIYSLNNDGERVVDSALVAGGLVFFTTFVPSSDPCTAGGYAYLYVFDYLCRDLQMDPLSKSGFTKQSVFDFDNLGAREYGMVKNGTKTVGAVAKLGVGMPSRPVLDSSALYIFVQTSIAQIHRIRVDLVEKPVSMNGWKEED